MSPSTMHKPRRPSPLTPPHSNHNSPEPDSENDTGSPTSSTNDRHSLGSEADFDASERDELNFDMDMTMDPAPPTPPVSPPHSTHYAAPSSPTKTKPQLHPYPRPSISQSQSQSQAPGHPSISLNRITRARLGPMSSVNPAPPSANSGSMPKSQPLSRALFARMANDVPHAGSGLGPKKKSGGEKLIIPTKSFRTTFELGLTASEFARR